MVYKKYKNFDVSYWSFGGVDNVRSIWSVPESASGIPFNQQTLDMYKGFSVRPSYLTVRDDGVTERFGGVIGDYTEENHALYKNNYQQVWTTISNSAYHGLEKMMRNDHGLRDQCIDLCVATAQELQVDVDVNFEAFSEYTHEFVENFKIFLSSLKAGLNAIGRKLCYDPLTMANAQMLGWYKFNYNDFIDHVDYLTIMCYDVMDFGVACDTIPVEALVGGTYNGKGMTGNPNGDEPILHFDGMLNILLQQIGSQNMHKIILGLPSYGFVNEISRGNYHYDNGLTTCLLEYKHGLSIEEMRRDGFRNNGVGALRLIKNGKLFCLDDKPSIDYKLDKINEWYESHNLNRVPRHLIFWHIGANNIGYDGTTLIEYTAGGTALPPASPLEPPTEPEPTPPPTEPEPTPPPTEPEPTPPPTEPEPEPTPPPTEVMPVKVTVFTEPFRQGKSKTYLEGQYNFHNDRLIKPIEVNDSTIAGHGKVVLFDHIFETPLYSVENHSENRQWIRLPQEVADKADSIIVTGYSLPTEPTPPPPTPEPTPPPTPEPDPPLTAKDANIIIEIDYVNDQDLQNVYNSIKDVLPDKELKISVQYKYE